MAHVAGKDGWFYADTNTPLSMREWRLEISTDMIDVTNFTSGGYREALVGFASGRFTARGPFESGEASEYTPGATINANLGLGSNYYLTFTGVLTRVAGSTSVDGAGMIELEGVTNGSFNTTFAVSS